MSKPTSGLYIPVLNKEGQFLFSIPVNTREDITEVATKMVTNPANGGKFTFGTKSKRIFLTYEPNDNTSTNAKNNIESEYEENEDVEVDTEAGTETDNVHSNFHNPKFVKKQYGCKNGDSCSWSWKCRFQCTNFQAGNCNFHNCAFHHFPNRIATEAAKEFEEES